MEMNNIYYRTFEKLEEKPDDIIIPGLEDGGSYKETQIDLNNKGQRRVAEKLEDEYLTKNFDTQGLMKLNALYKSFSTKEMDNQMTGIANRNASFRSGYEPKKPHRFGRYIQALRNKSNLNRGELSGSPEERGAKYVAERLGAYGYFGVDGNIIDHTKINGWNDKNLIFAIHLFQRCCDVYKIGAQKRYNGTNKIDMIIGPVGMTALAAGVQCAFTPEMIEGIESYLNGTKYELNRLFDDVNSGKVKATGTAVDKKEKTNTLEKILEKTSITLEPNGFTEGAFTEGNGYKNLTFGVNPKIEGATYEANINEINLTSHGEIGSNGYMFFSKDGTEYDLNSLKVGTHKVKLTITLGSEKITKEFDFTVKAKGTPDKVPETVDLTNDLADIDKSVATIFDDKKKSDKVTINNLKVKTANFNCKDGNYILTYNPSDPSLGYILTMQDGSEKFSKVSKKAYTSEGKVINDVSKVDKSLQTSVLNYKTMLGEIAKTFVDKEKTVDDLSSKIVEYNNIFDPIYSEWSNKWNEVTSKGLHSLNPKAMKAKEIKDKQPLVSQAIQELTLIQSKLENILNDLKAKYKLIKTEKGLENKDPSALGENMTKNIEALKTIKQGLEDKAEIVTLEENYNNLLIAGNQALKTYKEDPANKEAMLAEAEGKFLEAFTFKDKVSDKGTEASKKLKDVFEIKIQLYVLEVEKLKTKQNEIKIQYPSELLYTNESFLNKKTEELNTMKQKVNELNKKLDLQESGRYLSLSKETQSQVVGNHFSEVEILERAKQEKTKIQNIILPAINKQEAKLLLEKKETRVYNQAGESITITLPLCILDSLKSNFSNTIEFLSGKSELNISESVNIKLNDLGEGGWIQENGSKPRNQFIANSKDQLTIVFENGAKVRIKKDSDGPTVTLNTKSDGSKVVSPEYQKI